MSRTDRPDADTEETSAARLTVVARDKDERRVGRAFSGAAVEVALGAYPGCFLSAPPSGGQAYGVYVPGYVAQSAPDHHAVLPDGARVAVPAPEDTKPLVPVTDDLEIGRAHV